MRRTLILILALVAAGCGGGDPNVHKLKVGALPITDLEQLFTADAKGFLRDEGLEVEIQNFAGGAAIVPAVESGSVDVGWSNSVSILQARTRGLDVRFFAKSDWLREHPPHRGGVPPRHRASDALLERPSAGARRHHRALHEGRTRGRAADRLGRAAHRDLASVRRSSRRAT